MAKNLRNHRFLGEYRSETLPWLDEAEARVVAHTKRVAAEIRAMEKAGKVKFSANDRMLSC